MLLRHVALKKWIFHYRYGRMEGHKVEFDKYAVLIACGRIFSFSHFLFKKYLMYLSCYLIATFIQI